MVLINYTSVAFYKGDYYEKCNLIVSLSKKLNLQLLQV